jgi:ABC-type uncharacterized transport system ATPase subunit
VLELHAPHKVVTAHLDPKRPVPDLRPEDLPGRVLALTAEEVRLEVPREQVTTAAQELLSRLPALDLSIEGAEVGTVIEEIFRAGELPPEAR